jgi:hypothetical protein
MEIKKKMYDLKKGTVITTPNGVIELISDYDSFHGWYEVEYFDLNEDGELVPTGKYGHKTPIDLLNCEI